MEIKILLRYLAAVFLAAVKTSLATVIDSFSRCKIFYKLSLKVQEPSKTVDKKHCRKKPLLMRVIFYFHIGLSFTSPKMLLATCK